MVSRKNGGKVKPVNRNLLVEIQKQEIIEDKTSTFLLPEDYKKKAVERYSIVKILDRARDCDKVFERDVGTKCVVETTMINDIKIGDNVHNIVGENYVVLLLGD